MGFAITVAVSDMKGTFHKGYWIHSGQGDAYLWTPLPGNTLIKAWKCKFDHAPTEKEFQEKMVAQHLSRKFCSNNPLVRASIDKWTEGMEECPESVSEWSSWFKNDPEWLKEYGDGPLDNHLAYMQSRYSMSRDEVRTLREKITMMDRDIYHRDAAFTNLWVRDCQ
jgi:hypothetical protein